MPVSRYVLGCAAVAAFSTVVGLGTVVIVKGAVSGGSVQSLSQADVAAQLSAADADQSIDAHSSPLPSPSPTPDAPSKHPSGHPLTSQTGTQANAQSPRLVSSQGHEGTGQPGGSHQSDPAHTSTSSSHPRTSQDHPSTKPTPTPTTTPSPTASDQSVTKVLSSVGGSVVARCSAPNESATVYLVSWSPAQGYSVDEVRRGPAQEAEITFSSKAKQVNVTIHCSSSGPVEEVETEAGDG